MKRMINSVQDINTIDIEFDVYLPAISEELAATTILPLPDTREEADPLAVQNYDAFVECVQEIFDYYDFQGEKRRPSEFSTYIYYAHKSQLDAGNVPKYVRLRISSHVVKPKRPQHEAAIRDRVNRELEEIKLPKSKKKQRYMPEYITADRSLGFDTYEEVLNYAEERVRALFDILHLDVSLSDYDELGDF